MSRFIPGIFYKTFDKWGKMGLSSLKDSLNAKGEFISFEIPRELWQIAFDLGFTHRPIIDYIMWVQ